MRSFVASVLSLAVLGGLPLAARAQTVPCAFATNRAIIQQQLQSDLQAQIGAQQSTMVRQQILNTLELQSSLNHNDWAMRQILLQEQLNILRLEARQRALKAKTKKKLPR